MSFSQSNDLFQKVEPTEVVKDQYTKVAFSILKENKNDTPENQEAVFASPKYAVEIAVGLNTLKEYQALTVQNRLRICAHAELADEIAVAIIMLHRSGIYTLSNWLLMAKTPERAKIKAACFEYLKKEDTDNDIFIKKYKDKICTVLDNLNNQDSHNFCNALSFVFFDGNLTKENLKKLCADPKNALQIKEDLKSNASKTLKTPF